ncbi:restriction endonuclease subunit S [Pseudomonas sp. DE0010]|uniref:restriction endonuclease subunit S n=1 Tax=Pseudomonas sp. DE0010 TaxID=2584951 RepID=UPI0011A21E51|nr:restriction endonuclease subunit S [Pseudomonas sp. DE0010]
MSAVLTDNLPLLAGAPNGIKKLRELILELAVRGKLVPQDPSDEPASELLKLIAEEKARLVAQGKIKKQKPLAGVEEAALPFELPVAWVWARLGEITNFGTTTKKDEIPDDAWVLDLEDIEKDTSRLLQKTRFYERNSLSDKNSFAKGDVLYGKLRPYLNKVLVAEDDGFCTTEILPFRCHGPYVAHYFMVALKSPYFLSYVNAKSYGMKMPRLGTEDGRQALFPLPPLAEQHRIVAKVDELMALCDRLEARQADAVSAHVQLVQALLGSLTQASNAEDFAQSWQRLTEHFHALLTTESSIDALKQTLLQLAVMGKLVPQDPSDEPASELLRRIAEQKARLISEEGLRTTARDDVPEAEHYFRLHTGWASCRLGNLARFIDYRGRTPTKTSYGVPLITAKNVRPGFISRDPQEFIAETDYLSWMTRGFPRVGDMLFTTEAPMGNVAVIDIAERFALAQRVICFQLHELETGPFLKLTMMSSGFQTQLSDAATGMTATGIKSSRLKEIPVPIPPLAEQHRIVAKVDQLMALCDQLKARLNHVRQVHEHLASALVEQGVA